MNPSPWGGFMEGIAGGVKGGMDAYIQGQMSAIDKKQRVSQARAAANQDMFSNKNLPLKVRKQAWKNWLKENADWNTGITAPDLPDEMWEDKRLDAYLKRAIAIRDNKDYGLEDQIRFTKELMGEAISVLGQSAGAALEPVLGGMEAEAFKVGVGGLGKGQLTPQTIGLLGGSKAGRGMLAEQVKPVKIKTPRQGKTASYHRIGDTYYEFKDGKSRVMQKGDLKTQALVNAMREKEWPYLDEAGQYALFEKHLRLLKGEPSLSLDLSAKESPVPSKRGLIGGALDYLFPKHAEVFGFGAMGKEKDALLAKPQKPTVHQITRPGKLTRKQAIEILKAAKGDKALARKMAKEQGYSF